MRLTDGLLLALLLASLFAVIFNIAQSAKSKVTVTSKVIAELQAQNADLLRLVRYSHQQTEDALKAFNSMAAANSANEKTIEQYRLMVSGGAR